MAREHEVVIVGAGILGLASAYHILKAGRKGRLLVLDRLGGAGRGNTGRSAAAYRDMFTSPANRSLSQGSIAFYEEIQGGGVQLELMRIGYLWLLTAQGRSSYGPHLETMAQGGAAFRELGREELTRRLPGLAAQDIAAGILGSNCGILNPNRLASFYEEEVLRLGGSFAYNTEVTGFLLDSPGEIRGVKVDGKKIRARTVIVAMGAWMKAALARVGLLAPVVPKKRQLFAITTEEGSPLRRLHDTVGFNDYGLLPFTILPGQAYLRPAQTSFIAGYADEDQAPGLEERPFAEMDFFEGHIRPQLEQYFPAFRGAKPHYAWAGHYDYHPPDNLPFVDRIGGAIAVAGTSGSGIMKADALGRVVAGLYFGRERVELADGKEFEVAQLGLMERKLAVEEWVI